MNLHCLSLILFAALPILAGPADLMPWPARMERGNGRLRLDSTLSIAIRGGDERVTLAAERFVRQARVQTDGPFTLHWSATTTAKITIECAAAGLPVQSLEEDESYRLVIDSKQMRLTAVNPLGVIRGLATTLQLIEAGPEGWGIPAVTIDDHPRFAWRGLLIDVSRHFISIETLQRNIDGMAALKLNVLHLHLTDDQGFRIESRRYPNLAREGSDGLYYTQQQMRDLIQYARARGVRILAEIDIPGHAASWLTGYPQLASGPGPWEIIRTWGPHDPCLDPTAETTYDFLDGLLAEMTALFPDAYFHIGGDEVTGKHWAENARIQSWMGEHGMKDKQQLQAYFNRRVQALLGKYGKRMMGWDEILEPTLPKDILIHSWRGQKSLAEAARMGYSSILSTGWYLDLMEPAAKLYQIDPLTRECAGLTAAEKARILGGEADEWTEFADEGTLDGRIWPRLGAIAERLWSPAELRDVDSMYRRLDVLAGNLEFLSLRHRQNYRMMLARLAGGAPLGALDTLAAVVEPDKGHVRQHAAFRYTQQTPLNRLVDAVAAESDLARRFNTLAGQAAGTAAVRAELREKLELWKRNDAELRPLLERSFLLGEVIPVSRHLAEIAGIGLEALKAIDSSAAISTDIRDRQLAAISLAAKPEAELLIPVTSGVRLLVEAQRTITH